ncbi:hypothetical protein TNIN_424841 [Trichonephila inaurata madagascariensis]|uniref:Uncharacterized protein n=1 Tax=Trichonephila inaurata madagascariensis TaxID=2747483 RepID=A0A8X7BXR7_9ARAC|nr:hypothetical protein TNIN_424841 [Trichonephila inaurata madagascariensis]
MLSVVILSPRLYGRIDLRVSWYGGGEEVLEEVSIGKGDTILYVGLGAGNRNDELYWVMIAGKFDVSLDEDVIQAVGDGKIYCGWPLVGSYRDCGGFSGGRHKKSTAVYEIIQLTSTTVTSAMRTP